MMSGLFDALAIRAVWQSSIADKGPCDGSALNVCSPVATSYNVDAGAHAEDTPS